MVNYRFAGCSPLTQRCCEGTVASWTRCEGRRQRGECGHRCSRTAALTVKAGTRTCVLFSPASTRVPTLL
jgi:hypothetical protein